MSAEALAALLRPSGYEVLQWHDLMTEYEIAPRLRHELLYAAGLHAAKLLTDTDRDGNAFLYLHRQHDQAWVSTSSFKQVELPTGMPDASP